MSQGLGAFAQGFTGGLSAGQRFQANKMEMDQRQKQLDDQAAIAADMKAADEAARAAAQQMRAQHEQQFKGVDAYLTRGGSDGSLGEVAQDAVSQPIPEFKPTKRQMLATSEARTNELLKRGRVDQAMKLWAQDEGMRLQLRQEEAQRGLAQFKATGDPTALLKGVYENVDDGYDISNIIQGPETQDGVKIFGVERVNQATGKKEVHELRSDEIEGLVMQSLDPKGAAEYAWRSKLEAFKGKRDRETNDARHKLTLEEIDRRGKYTLEGKEIDAKSREAVADTRAEAFLNGKKMQIDGMLSATQLRAALKGSGGGGGGKGGAAGVHSKQVLDDGRVVLIMRDGSQKILTDDNGAPARGIDAEKLLATVTRDIGRTMEGAMSGYTDNRGKASATLPKPPPAAPKSLADAVPKTGYRMRFDANGNPIK